MTEQEIIESIDEVFRVCPNLDRKLLWYAIVPTDAELQQQGLPPEQKAVTLIPSRELFELEAFVTLIDSLGGSPSLDEKNKIRLMLVGYCRMMESDLPFAVVWNLLRAASGKPGSWTFTKVSKTGNILTCEYPREKIEEICSLSHNLSMKVGGVLAEIWDPYLRNSISHAQYFLTDNRYVPSRGLSPISRKQGGDLTGGGRSMTFDEVRALYGLARTFVTRVVRCWRQECENLK